MQLSLAHGDAGLRDDLYEADGLPWGPASAKAARLLAHVWKALFRIPHGEALHIPAQYSILPMAHADFVESPYTKPSTSASDDLHAYDHTTLKAPHPVRSAQLNNVTPHQYLDKVSAKICILSVAHGDVGLREDLYEANRLPWGPVSEKLLLSSQTFANLYSAFIKEKRCTYMLNIPSWQGRTQILLNLLIRSPSPMLEMISMPTIILRWCLI
ncbi:hypothetical protein M513_13811 [Trichuris suis]|uniref:Uncharacterized protein n=1 Tax=Trichuris suis TaxID=68888 RepID=A0A085LK16_9BILA|nr:hypothetical protein M513_13811 [Trichuris suis]